jgi:hypothetical protein
VEGPEQATDPGGVKSVTTQTQSFGVDERRSLAGTKSYEFDAFVSYCEADEEWTLAELIKPMQDAGLRVIDKQDFDIGAFKIDAHVRAVDRSRRVIIVVTPAWCESQWEEFDSLIAQTPNPGNVFPRLIPLILQSCPLPPRIAALVPADFTDMSLRRDAFDRLLRNLGRTAQEINEATTRAVKKGIAALADLLRIPTLQDYLRSYNESIAEASELIGVLGRCKRLHDYFQKTEGAYKLLLRSRKGVSAGVDTWDELEEAAFELSTELELLLQFARDGGFPPNEILWTSKLERMSCELKTAVKDQDDEKLGGICERLLKLLATQPTRINDRLVHTAGQLALGAVADKLRKICSSMIDMLFDEEAQERLEEFTRGIDSLGRLDNNLRILINNHNCLQAIDDSLRSFDMTLHPSPAEIADTWVDLCEPLGLLNGDCGATWLAGLRELGQKMDALVLRPPTEPKAVREFQALFRDARDKIYRGFNQTDEDLRRFCEQLQKVGDTLSSAIGRMQHV